MIAGLEILRTLDERGIETKRPIEVVNWTNEEGARFPPPMLASLVFSGAESVAFAEDRRDKAGLRFGDELERIGYRGDAPVGGRKIDCYFELHIEQGPKLDAAGLPLGIVTGGFAMQGMRISVQGETAHSGPTPMTRRRNALVGASYVAVAVDDIGWRYAPEDGKTTVARLDLRPNLPASSRTKPSCGSISAIPQGAPSRHGRGGRGGGIRSRRGARARRSRSPSAGASAG